MYGKCFFYGERSFTSNDDDQKAYLSERGTVSGAVPGALKSRLTDDILFAF